MSAHGMCLVLRKADCDIGIAIPKIIETHSPHISPQGVPSKKVANSRAPWLLLNEVERLLVVFE